MLRTWICSGAARDQSSAEFSLEILASSQASLINVCLIASGVGAVDYGVIQPVLELDSKPEAVTAVDKVKQDIWLLVRSDNRFVARKLERLQTSVLGYLLSTL